MGKHNTLKDLLKAILYTDDNEIKIARYGDTRVDNEITPKLYKELIKILG